MLGITVLSIFLFVLFDFLHESRSFSKQASLPIWLFLKVYLFQIPTLLCQSLPIAALLASVSTMILLSRSNEITAMRSFGMSAFAISKPLLIGGVILTLTMAFIGEFIQPEAAKKAYEYKQKLKGRKSKAVSGFGWFKQKNTFVNYKRFDPQKKEFKLFSLYQHNNDFKIVKIIKSSSAKLDEPLNKWNLLNPQISYFDDNSELVSVDHRKTMQIHLDIRTEQLISDSRLSSEKSLRELDGIINVGMKTGQNVRQELVDFHNKISFFFAPILIVFLGLRFAYGSNRNVETVRGILFALAVGASYWLIFSAFRAFALQGNVSPIFSAWFANIIIVLLITYDFKSSRSS